MCCRELGNKRGLRLDCRNTFPEFQVAKTVEQIRAQIAKLQAQEEALLAKEALGVIAKIRVAVEHYGITPEQIFGASAVVKKAAGRAAAKPRAGAAKKTKKVGRVKAAEPASVDKPKKAASVPKGTKVAAKYKDDSGNAWSGRGSQPKWLRAAIEGGKKLEDFAVA